MIFVYSNVNNGKKKRKKEVIYLTSHPCFPRNPSLSQPEDQPGVSKTPFQAVLILFVLFKNMQIDFHFNMDTPIF